MSSTETDVVVVGGGPAGENAASYARENGLEVTVVESERVGGECSYWACMPSKALLMPGHALAAARRMPGAREAVTGDLDVEAVLENRTAFASGFDDSAQVEWLESEGIALVRGHGRLSGEREVTVEHGDGTTIVLRARRAVVLATGSRAVIPPVDGLAEARPWDNRDVTSATEVPRRLVVMGGGVVGVEMSQAWRRLGVEELTLVEAGERLLGPEEPFVGEAVQEALEADGVDVRVGTSLTAARRDGDDGPVTVTLDDGAEVEADELLVAVGRRAATDDLGLESVGLEPGEAVEVDGHLRARGVDGGWLYAVGDVNGRALLTHHGKYQARMVGDAIAGRDVDEAWADEDALVRVVFTDPEMAAVGLTEQQARERYDDVVTLTYDVGKVAGGALQGEGFGGPAQLVVDRGRRVVVGATFVGPGVGELLHAATVAVVSQVTLDRLWHAVPAFPTVSEVWLRLLEASRDV